MFKKGTITQDDNSLIDLALDGNKKALERLIKKHQNWIYNVALSMTCHDEDAADITQEVLIKIITKLDSFKRQSKFTTWAYRIVKNHFLNMKRGKFEITPISFQKFGNIIDSTPDENIEDTSYSADSKILTEETKVSCMRAMLLCLSREQRFIFILGEIFEFSDVIGSEIMEISPGNFRVKLHRTRKQLYNFMNNKCGLINKNNPCRCAKKTIGFIKMGAVDPKNLYFQKNKISTIEKTLNQKIKMYDNKVMNEYKILYQKHPYLESNDAIRSIKNLLSSKVIKETFNF